MTLFSLTMCVTNTSSGNFCDVYEVVPTLEGGRKAQRDAIDFNNAYHMENCNVGI
jgi:hypothetical protein